MDKAQSPCSAKSNPNAPPTRQIRPTCKCNCVTVAGRCCDRFGDQQSTSNCVIGGHVGPGTNWQFQPARQAQGNISRHPSPSRGPSQAGAGSLTRLPKTLRTFPVFGSWIRAAHPPLRTVSPGRWRPVARRWGRAGGSAGGGTSPSRTRRSGCCPERHGPSRKGGIRSSGARRRRRTSRG